MGARVPFKASFAWVPCVSIDGTMPRHSLLSILLIALSFVTVSCAKPAPRFPQAAGYKAGGEEAAQTLESFIPQNSAAYYVKRLALPATLAASMEGDPSRHFAESIAEFAPEMGEEYAPLVELLGKFSRRDDLTRLGLTPGGIHAVYLSGMRPVLRAPVIDAKRFAENVEPMLRKAELQYTKTAFEDGQRYTFKKNEWTVVMLLTEAELLMTIGGKDVNGPSLDALLLAPAPAVNIANQGVSSELRRKHELTPHLIAHVDFVALAEMFTGTREGVEGAELVPPFDRKVACRDEALAAIRHTPSITVGYTGVTDNHVSGRMQLDTSEELGADLARLVAHTHRPPQALLDRALLHISAAFDSDTLFEILERRGKETRQAPHVCDDFSEVNELASLMDALSLEDLPVWARGISGASLTVVDARFGEDQIPEVDAIAMLQTTRGEELVEMVRMEVPGFESFKLPPNGLPVPLPRLAIPFPLDSPVAGLLPDALGVALGTESTERLQATLANPNAATPLVSLRFDVQRFIQLLKKSPVAELVSGGAFDMGELQKLTHLALDVTMAERGLRFDGSATYVTRQ